MAMLNVVALFSAIAVIILDRNRPKIQLAEDPEEEPLVDNAEA